MAILEREGRPYLVCTLNRGVVGGEPIMAGGAYSVTHFD